MSKENEYKPVSISKRFQNIGKQTLIAAGTGMTLGTVISMVLLKPHAFKNGIKMGINWGTLGLVFFSMRNNMAERQEERNFYKGLNKGFTRDSDDLYISTLSGMATGGLMSGLVFGPRKIAPGLFYYGIGAAVLQSIYTFLNNYRKQKILNGSTLISSLPNYSFGSIIDAFLTSLPDNFPISKVNDEEYLPVLEDKIKTLKEELTEVDNQLKQLEPELLKSIELRPKIDN